MPFVKAMVKVRMTTADVAAEVACLKKTIGMRLSNVYDLNPKVCVQISFEVGGSELTLMSIRFHRRHTC